MKLFIYALFLVPTIAVAGKFVHYEQGACPTPKAFIGSDRAHMFTTFTMIKYLNEKVFTANTQKSELVSDYLMFFFRANLRKHLTTGHDKLPAVRAEKVPRTMVVETELNWQGPVSESVSKVINAVKMIAASKLVAFLKDGPAAEGELSYVLGPSSKNNQKLRYDFPEGRTFLPTISDKLRNEIYKALLGSFGTDIQLIQALSKSLAVGIAENPPLAQSASRRAEQIESEYPVVLTVQSDIAYLRRAAQLREEIKPYIERARPAELLSVFRIYRTYRSDPSVENEEKLRLVISEIFPEAATSYPKLRELMKSYIAELAAFKVIPNSPTRFRHAPINSLKPTGVIVADGKHIAAKGLDAVHKALPNLLNYAELLINEERQEEKQKKIDLYLRARQSVLLSINQRLEAMTDTIVLTLKSAGVPKNKISQWTSGDEIITIYESRDLSAKAAAKQLMSQPGLLNELRIGFQEVQSEDFDFYRARITTGLSLDLAKTIEEVYPGIYVVIENLPEQNGRSSARIFQWKENKLTTPDIDIDQIILRNPRWALEDQRKAS